MKSPPHVVVLAGPNGAGKSTSAPELLQGPMRVQEFVNADVLARGLSGFHPDRAAMAAGRVMLARMRELAMHRASFAFETTLASRSFAPWLARLRRKGYSVHLLFLWLPGPELALERVRERVRLGGHGVPEDVVRRRYASGLRNLFGLYLPLADDWAIYDNSGGSPRLIAAGNRGQADAVVDQTIWDRIRRGR